MNINQKSKIFLPHPNSHIQYSNIGFTIVELLVVIVVIGILAALTIVAYTGISSRAVTASVKSDIAQAYKQLEISKISSSTDAYPINLASASLKSSNGTTYDYYSDSPYKSYCLAATNNSTVYSVSDSNPTPLSGNCLSNGLVGYWALDNTTGMTDLSGNGNNGTANGSIAIGTAVNHLGAANKATTFDGVDDYVGVANFMGGTNSFTVSHRIYLTINQTIKTIFSNYGSASRGWVTGISDSNANVFKFYLGNNVTLHATTPFTTATWYNVIVTYNNGNPKIFINGSLNNSSTDTIVFASSYFGNDIGHLGIGGQFFNGLIDDVRI
ncbi:MAG: LamG domain-containing protein, partial [Candidatus Saccharibacteria bacterium]